MKLKITLLLLFLFFVLLNYGQRTKYGFFNNLDEAIADSGFVKCLYIDFNIEEESVFNEKIGSFTKLHSLTVVNFEQKDLPSSFYNLKDIDSIIISDCPKINFRLLFKNLSKLKTLSYIELEGNDIREIPEEINNLQNLKTFKITNNENLLLSESVEILKLSPTLTELALPINDITELPDNIGSLKQIKVLDLSNNYLTDLPDSIAGMNNLIKIRLEGNNIVDPISTTKKMKGLDIKYLSIDKGLTVDEIKKLKSIFPDCEIKEIKPSLITGKDKKIVISNDSLNITEINISNKVPEIKDSVNYGTFQIEQSDFAALSTSYIHYPALIRNPLLKVEFDSLLFDERYHDTTYCNITKINRSLLQRSPESYNYLYLELVKPKTKKQIWFKLNVGDQNIEVNAFNKVPWVYSGELSLKKFRKTYIKSGRKQQKYWRDIRFYYDDASKLFTIELKDRNSFVQFNATPANLSSTMTRETFQQKFPRLYASYCKALDRRRKRFHKNLFSNKMIVDKNYKKNKERLWTAFRDMYMSPEEKKMTPEEWLKYYDKVIAHEKKTLYAATADESNLKRSLVLNQFELLNQSDWIGRNNCTEIINASFEDKAKNNLPVISIIIIDKENSCFYSVSGTVGLGEQTLMACNRESIKIIAVLRNGDIGIVLPDELKNKNTQQINKKILMVQVIPKSLCSVGQIMDLIGL
ncbi:MAG: leucine-rich repeat domain-containing protein [Bacteroidia bacterium]|nr:leucine-rich repeat domain-containing protein [Bacteroidia bacterium]